MAVDRAVDSKINYFHGGVPGLLVNSLILPAAQTGHPCASDYGADHVHRRDRVYLTSEFNAAVMFACLYPNRQGVVYLVEPIGEIEDDPDCDTKGMSFQCESARVIRRIDIPYRVRVEVLEALLSSNGRY